MSFFQESAWRPTDSLSPEQVAYFREVLATHTNQPTTGRCRVCHLPSCQDLRDAYDQLAAAGELMAEPERWLSDAVDTEGSR